MHVLRNVEDAKRLGKEIPIKEVKALINDFREFNPFHVLGCEEDAQAYLDENWEGRMLDFQHFGFPPRDDRRRRRKPSVRHEGQSE